MPPRKAQGPETRQLPDHVTMEEMEFGAGTKTWARRPEVVLQGEVCWARKHNHPGQILGKAQKYLPTFTSVAPGLLA